MLHEGHDLEGSCSARPERTIRSEPDRPLAPLGDSVLAILRIANTESAHAYTSASANVVTRRSDASSERVGRAEIEPLPERDWSASVAIEDRSVCEARSKVRRRCMRSRARSGDVAAGPPNEAVAGTRLARITRMITGAMMLFGALTLTLAAILVLYALGVARAFASPRDRVARPALALIPLATPVLAWRAGARATAIALVASAILYGLLQLWAHSR